MGLKRCAGPAAGPEGPKWCASTAWGPLGCLAGVGAKVEAGGEAEGEAEAACTALQQEQRVVKLWLGVGSALAILYGSAELGGDWCSTS